MLLQLNKDASCIYINETGAKLLPCEPVKQGIAMSDVCASLREKDFITLKCCVIRCSQTSRCDEIPCRRKDGIWLMARLLPVGSDGENSLLIAMTVSKAEENGDSLEKKLKEKKLDLMHDSAIPVTFEIDINTRTIILSDQFRLLYDVCEPIIRPTEKSFMNNRCISRDTLPEFCEAFRQIHDRQPNGSLSMRLRSRLTGSYFSTSAYWKTLFDDDGNAVRIIGILKSPESRKKTGKSAMLCSLQLQLQLQDAYLYHTSEYLQELRRYRHDRSNNIIALRAFLLRGDTEGALKYLDRMGDSLRSGAPIINTGNPPIDAIITEKLTVAKKLGVNVSHTVGLQPGLKADMMDLTVAVGNCLDNAVESCSHTIAAGQKAFIELKFVEQKGVLVFHLRNSTLPQPDPADELPETTKPDKENHGFGLRNVQRIVEKYGGKLILSVGQNEFTTAFTLFVP